MLNRSCIFGFIFVSFACQAQECPPDRIDETVILDQIVDGDTIKIKDGRMIRFIGIDTPELHYDGKQHEPYALQARDMLKKLLISNNTLSLRYDAERFDRYHRVLAHLFLQDGRNVEALLLKQGLATTLVIPPNLWNSDCYRAVELKAIQLRQGLWAHPKYQVIDATQLNADDLGFRIIKGHVSHVSQSEKSIWVNLKGGLALRIARNDLQYFKGLNVLTLKNRQITVRGRLYKHSQKLRMRLRHASVLQVLE